MMACYTMNVEKIMVTFAELWRGTREMDAFFKMLRREKGFIIVYSILRILWCITGVDSMLDTVLGILTGILIITIAHDGYESIRERIVCIVLAVFLILVTYLAGMEIVDILTRIVAAAITSVFLIAMRFVMKKF